MNGISGFYGYYPNQFQVTANPTGAGLAQLNSDFARDFGLNTTPIYNLPIDVNMAFGGMYGGGIGMGMGMYGMGMYNPYMMMSPRYLEYLNMDFKERLAYDAQLRDAARETQYNEGKSSKNYASATDGLTGSIREACNSLQTVIIEGEADQIVTQFDRIVEALRNSPLYTRLQDEFKNDPTRLEMTLRNCAKEQFQAVTGQDLKAMIQQHCDSTLVNAFWNTISFGNAQNHSAEEVIAHIEGSEAPKSEGSKKAIGKVGGVTATTLAGAGVGSLICPGIGTVLGAGVGAIAGIIGSFM